jgi:FkbM family methyltransferase
MLGINRQLLMKIKPLWLREKIYFRFYAGMEDQTFQYERAPLEFSKKIKLRLCKTDFFHKQIANTGFYELSETRKITALAQKGGIFLDVGANYGYYTCLWASINSENRVLAFEPAPLCFRNLEINVKENGLENRCKLFQIAIADDNDTRPFDLGSTTQTGWGGLLKERISTGIPVSVVRLEDFLKDEAFIRINVLKIDTEGSDYLVLKGAESLLKQHKIKHIFFEENVLRLKLLGLMPGKAENFLKFYGYKVIKIAGRDNLKTFYAHLV